MDHRDRAVRLSYRMEKTPNLLKAEPNPLRRESVEHRMTLHASSPAASMGLVVSDPSVGGRFPRTVASPTVAGGLPSN
jgi:hypothetical protein